MISIKMLCGIDSTIDVIRQIIELQLLKSYFNWRSMCFPYYKSANSK